MPPLSDKQLQVKKAAEADLETFVRLVAPYRLIGGVHRELMGWWTREEAKSHQLVLLPRDHGKSAYVGYRVAWEITKNPIVRILYLSSTSPLAIKQLKFIKDILTSDAYRRYWPEMAPCDGTHKWAETEIEVAHPLRREEGIRDATVFVGGLTTSLTGFHCDVAVFDDVVVQENAYDEPGREKVQTQYSLLASIEGADAREWVVGTRYHPEDLYGKMVKMEVNKYDEYGNVVESEHLYDVFERKVESAGDGSGEYLWPRQQRPDGAYFGFNRDILERKRTQYLDKTQFRAQYYNDPVNIEDAPIKPENFNYFERKFVHKSNGGVHFKTKRLNVFAAVDFAYSLSRRSDYTSIVVVGVDGDNNYYILDIDRFKTNKISDYYNRIKRLHVKWEFRKIRAEVTAAQTVIVKDLKENYIIRDGLAMSIDEFRPTRHMGNKMERIMAILEPKYQNGQVYHYMGANCQILEEELATMNPSHDDVMDALANAIDIATPPTGLSSRHSFAQKKLNTHSRFGGIL